MLGIGDQTGESLNGGLDFIWDLSDRGMDEVGRKKKRRDAGER